MCAAADRKRVTEKLQQFQIYNTLGTRKRKERKGKERKGKERKGRERRLPTECVEVFTIYLTRPITGVTRPQ